MSKQIHAVGVIFEDISGRILVLKRHPLDPEGKKWGLVGGKVDPGERPMAAAIREVEEEIGHLLDRTQLDFLKTYHWNWPGLDIVFDVYRYTGDTTAVRIELDDTESTTYKWVKPAVLYQREDLMIGLYPILKDHYNGVA